MVGHVRLLFADFLDQIAHAFLLSQQRFQNLQTRFIPQRPHDARAFPFGQHRFRHVSSNRRPDRTRSHYPQPPHWLG